MHKIAIALGGNIGNMEVAFHKAIAMLSPFVSNIRMAPIIITEPVDCIPGTPDFHNSALIGDTDMQPVELLLHCQSIEQRLGRPRSHSSRESRTIDLDLLLYDELEMETPQLTLPHPRMHLRRFVLEPLSNLAPDWRVPPNMRTVMELLEVLKAASL